VAIKLNITPSYIGKSHEELSQGARRALAANILANLAPASPVPAPAATTPALNDSVELLKAAPSEQPTFCQEAIESQLQVETPVEQLVTAPRIGQWQSSLNKVDIVFAAESDPIFDFLFDSDSERCETSIQEAIKEAYAIIDVASISQRDEKFHENLFRMTEALKAAAAQEPQRRNNVLYVTSESLKRPA
jgi:hypothetical protein